MTTRCPSAEGLPRADLGSRSTRTALARVHDDQAPTELLQAVEAAAHGCAAHGAAENERDRAASDTAAVHNGEEAPASRSPPRLGPHRAPAAEGEHGI